MFFVQQINNISLVEVVVPIAIDAVEISRSLAPIVRLRWMSKGIIVCELSPCTSKSVTEDDKIRSE